MGFDEDVSNINVTYFWTEFLERDDFLVSAQFQVVVVWTTTVITTSLNVDCGQVQSKWILPSEEIATQLKMEKNP